MLQRSILLTVLFGLGCAQWPSDDGTGDITVKSAPSSVTDEAFVRMELAELKGELPEIGYQQFIEDAAVVETVSIGGSDGLDSSVRKLLLVLVNETTEKLNSQVVKIQRFRINRGFPAVRILGSRLSALLPFNLHTDAVIEFARLYKNEADAAGHDSFSLLDYPHDAQSALRLPEGTVVTMPVEANISIDVGGGFISKSTRFSPQLVPHFDTSAIGSMSAARRGTLVGSGRFRIQLVRLGEDRVRLRLISSAHKSVSGSANLSSFSQARYAFLPAAYLDRLRSVRRRMDQLQDGWEWIAQGEERIQSLREQLPDMVRNIVDSTPFPIPRRAHQFIDAAVQLGDRLLGQAERLAEHASDLDERIGTRVTQLIDGTTGFWDDRIEPVRRTIRNLSSRVFSFAQSVQLNDQLTRNLRLLADYEFDLSSEDARIAFERAISGRSVWRGAVESLTNWKFDSMTFADFTLADTLANVDAQADYPRVRRLAQGGADMRRRVYSLSVNAFGMSVGLNGEFQNNRIRLRDDEGQETTWHTRAWERGQNTQLFGQVRSESFASGAFTNQSGDDPLDGGYWFRWKKTFGDRAATPIADTIAHVLNDIGPMAVTLGVGQMYQGEFAGKTSADLFVAFDTEALDVIFDPNKTTDEFLWEVLGDMMDRYQRPTFLPYAHAPIRPRALDEIPGARHNCERIAKRIGGRYCYSFLDRIFPALRRAQSLKTPGARLDFFESFYRVPAGGAVLSTRFLVRYIAEILHAHEVTDGVSLDINIHNNRDDSEAASPRLVVGDAKALMLGESTILSGLNHR